MIIDPDGEHAIDSDGALMGAVRGVPWPPGAPPPTPADLAAAPVIGYARPVCPACQAQHPAAGQGCSTPPQGVAGDLTGYTLDLTFERMDPALRRLLFGEGDAL